jgi:hypothetical protein
MVIPITRSMGSYRSANCPTARKGIIEDLADVFGVQKVMVAGFVRVAAMKKRVANKRPCPCGGELRLGLCHRKRLNMLRRRLGRRWFGYLKLQLDS